MADNAKRSRVRRSASKQDERDVIPALETSSRGQGSSERRIRVTLDLTREQHRFLRSFALDADADASSVLRLLLLLLQEDAVLAATVHGRVERRYLT